MYSTTVYSLQHTPDGYVSHEVLQNIHVFVEPRRPEDAVHASEGYRYAAQHQRRHPEQPSVSRPWAERGTPEALSQARHRKFPGWEGGREGGRFASEGANVISPLS